MLRYDPAALADPYLIYHFEKGGEYTFTDFITMSKRLCQFFERFKSLDQIMLVPPTSEGYGDFTRAVHWEHMYDMIVNEISDLLTLVLINIDFNCIKEKDADLGDIRRILAKDVIIPAFNFDTMIAVNIVPNSKMGHDPNHMNIISWTHLMELYDEYANGEI